MDGIGRERRQAAATRNLGERRFLHAALASCSFGSTNEQLPSAAWSKLAGVMKKSIPLRETGFSRSRTGQIIALCVAPDRLSQRCPRPGCRQVGEAQRRAM